MSTPTIRRARHQIPAITTPAKPASEALRAQCGVCRTRRAWPVALPGTAKRFFCMTCERNTVHSKITEP